MFVMEIIIHLFVEGAYLPTGASKFCVEKTCVNSLLAKLINKSFKDQDVVAVFSIALSIPNIIKPRSHV